MKDLFINKGLVMKTDKDYKHIDHFEIEDCDCYIEPNFYTQLEYIKDHFESKFELIVDEIMDSTERNKHVIFTADYENPVVYKEGYIYREIDDILGLLKLSIDNKSNPDSDWKD